MVATYNAQNQGLFAQGSPPYAEITRQGIGWNCSISSAIAPLAAIPTTTAGLELFNNSQASGAPMAMVVDTLFAFELAATNVVRTYAIWAMVTTAKVVPTLGALSVFSHSGRAFYTTTAASRVVSGLGTTVIANGWRPWGPVNAWGTLPTAIPGASYTAEVNGRLLVPPGASLCVHVAGALATGTFTFGASWYEVSPITVVNV